MIFCRKEAKSSFRKYMVWLGYNPEEYYGATSATKTFGELSVFMAALHSRCEHYIFVLWFFFLLSFSSTCSRNMVDFGPLAAEICSLVWGIPANFNGFRVLASLLQLHCSPEANQTLHDVWPSPGLLQYIYIFGGSCPVM